MKAFKPESDLYGEPIRDKYELIDMEDGSGLYRIRAIRDIPLWKVKAGDWGGEITSEKNLLTFGDAWIGYEAKVTGDAQIIFGHVDGESHVFGDVLMKKGQVLNSVISGEVSIEGDFTFLNTTVQNGKFEGAGSIVDSKLENVQIVPLESESCIFSNVEIVSDGDFVIDGKNIWSDVKIKAKRGRVISSLEMRDSQLNVDLFEVQQKTEIDYMVADAPELLLSIGDVYTQMNFPKEAVTLKGFSKSKPLVIQGTSLTVISSTIEGNISISGAVQINDSTIRDFANIDCVGRLSNVGMSELSSIFSTERIYCIVEDINLTQDTVYEA